MSKRIFISTKFKGIENESHLGELARLVEELGHVPYVAVKELDDFGRATVLKSHREFMDEVAERIREVDVMLVDWIDKGVGIGVEAGAAWILGKPVVVAHPADVEVSMTILGVASQVISYANYEDLQEKLRSVL